MAPTFLARTHGLDAVAGIGPDDRRRTADAASTHERRAAAKARHGYRGRRWQREAARPDC